MLAAVPWARAGDHDPFRAGRPVLKPVPAEPDPARRLAPGALAPAPGSLAEWQTTSRRVYIVPTRSGIVYAVLMAALLVASINDRLNLGFALCFTLRAAAWRPMWQGQRNLRGLQAAGPTPDQVSGQALTIVPLWTIGRPAKVRPTRWARERLGQEAPEPVDLAAHGHATPAAPADTPAPGTRPLARRQAGSRHPLGLFVCWTLWQPLAGGLDLGLRRNRTCPMARAGRRRAQAG